MQQCMDWRCFQNHRNVEYPWEFPWEHTNDSQDGYLVGRALC
jgi:hypothetical protein